MLNIFENKKTYLVTMLICILILNIVGCSKKDNNNFNEDILLGADKFINLLFENELEKAGELSLGVVRFNVLSNKVESESNFSIENINSNVIFTSEDLAIANSTVSYIDKINSEHDTVFYEIKLLKENDLWKVYHLNETDPSFNNENNSNKKITNTDPSTTEEDLKEVFIRYTESLSKGKYQESSQYLIGRAKKMHKKANAALSELNLVSRITDLDTEVIYGEENNIVAKFNYKNDDRPISVLVYFYLTEQGWRIYNVNQI